MEIQEKINSILLSGKFLLISLDNDGGGDVIPMHPEIQTPEQAKAIIVSVCKGVIREFNKPGK